MNYRASAVYGGRPGGAIQWGKKIAKAFKEDLSRHFHEYTHLPHFYWENESVSLFYFHHDLKRSLGIISKPEEKLYTEHQFGDDRAVGIFRSIKTTDLTGNRLFVNTHPGFNQSEYNFDMLYSSCRLGSGYRNQIG